MLHKMFQSLQAKGQRLLMVSVPYLWLSFFFLVPFLIILKISFSYSIVGIPPFANLIQASDDYLMNITLNLKNYVTVFSDAFYVESLLNSIKVSCFATFFCLILGYTIAYNIYKAPVHYRTLLLMLIMLPFWTSFLVRIYALMNIMSNQGPINDCLMFLGFIKEPLDILGNIYAVCVGIVYCYLPFMILPLYATLEKIDNSCIEAASDLGANPWRAFWRVTLPLSTNGIIAGSILVFIPAIGEFVIPELLGGPETVMIGRTLWWEFFNNRDWPLASALAVVMIILFVIPIMYAQRNRVSMDN
jgi:putrescine transport system permease protein